VAWWGLSAFPWILFALWIAHEVGVKPPSGNALPVNGDHMGDVVRVDPFATDDACLIVGGFPFVSPVFLLVLLWVVFFVVIRIPVVPSPGGGGGFTASGWVLARDDTRAHMYSIIILCFSISDAAPNSFCLGGRCLFFWACCRSIIAASSNDMPLLRPRSTCGFVQFCS